MLLSNLERLPKDVFLYSWSDLISGQTSETAIGRNVAIGIPATTMTTTNTKREEISCSSKATVQGFGPVESKLGFQQPLLRSASLALNVSKHPWRHMYGHVLHATTLCFT